MASLNLTLRQRKLLHTIQSRSGMITGQDLVSQLKGCAADEILITENMLRKGDDVFLDNLSLPEAIEQLGIPIRPVPDDGGALLDALLGKELS